MAIKVVSRDEVNKYKIDSEIQQIKELEAELNSVDVEITAQIKEALLHLTDLDYLYELQDCIDDLIRGWDGKKLKTEDYEDEED